MPELALLREAVAVLLLVAVHLHAGRIERAAGGQLPRLLSLAAHRCSWRVHAWCLMGNHYHLLVEARTGEVSAGVQLLNGRYAQFFNERHDLHGHLWGQRFRVTFVESDAHLERAILYILENPLRAQLVSRADDWTWSGFSLPNAAARDRAVGTPL